MSGRVYLSKQKRIRWKDGLLGGLVFDGLAERTHRNRPKGVGASPVSQLIPAHSLEVST